MGKVECVARVRPVSTLQLEARVERALQDSRLLLEGIARLVRRAILQRPVERAQNAKRTTLRPVGVFVLHAQEGTTPTLET